VTSFFRDPPTWELLSAEVLPRLLADKDDREPLRIWSAGCASGEEAYSLAMVTAEAMGADAARERSRSTPPTSTRRRSTRPARPAI
jgi:two-component system, chemotaxis family, CheB/CheR fusion protein